MKFKFTLDKVLKHRKILEDLAQKDFQEAMSELNKQNDVLNSLIQMKTEARKRAFEQQVQAGGQVLESLKQIHEFVLLQDIRIEKQRQIIQVAEKLVEEKREVLRQKAMDTKIIKRLEEKKRQEFNAEMAKREQKELDDNTSLRFDLLRKIKNI